MNNSSGETGKKSSVFDSIMGRIAKAGKKGKRSKRSAEVYAEMAAFLRARR
jgi:hypothetical protein